MRTKKPKPPLERDVSKAIVEYFAVKYGIELFRRNTATFFMGGRMVKCGEKGQADRWGIIAPQGVAIEIEVKQEGKTPTLEQIAWLASCRKKGAIAFWANSIEDAETKFLEQWEERQ